MKVVVAKNIKKSFDGREVISNISFSANSGDIIAIFGPNGSGKSTLLNILAGVTKQSSGIVRLQKTSKTDFSYIFQNYRETLLPWKNNYTNISFPLRVAGYSSEQIEERLRELEKIFYFSSNLTLFPYQLSGGQQQILAFMRALVNKPKIIFMDEPFSALDYENNLLLRNHLQEYHKQFNPTIITVTHDIEEAVHIANKIIVLSKKPSRVISIIENNASFPRTVDFLKSKRFDNIRQKVIRAFEKGAKNV